MIDVILAISISAFIVQFLLSVMMLYKNFRADENTELHAERVFRVMAGYVLRKGCLPYPADPAGNSGEQFPPPPNESGWAGCKIMRGIVPYKTLGLDEKYAKDGAGNYFTYIVTPGLCERGNLPSVGINNITEFTAWPVSSYRKVLSSGISKDDKSDYIIDIVDNYDTIVSRPNEVISEGLKTKFVIERVKVKDCIALVLISHKNGAGSYGANGKVKKIKNKESTTNGNDKNENTPYEFYADTEDKVYWHSRFNFLSMFANVQFDSVNVPQKISGSPVKPIKSTPSVPQKK